MSKKQPKTSREVKRLSEQIQELRTKIATLEKENTALLYALAEAQNTLRRIKKNGAEELELAKTGFMTQITPVLDNFERALKSVPPEHADSNWIKGLLSIRKQLEDILARVGFERIPTDGEFDHNLHEAVSYEDNSLPANHIIKEVQSGWRFNGKVIKPAKVRVSRGPQK